MKNEKINKIIFLLSQKPEEWDAGVYVNDYYTLCHKSGFSLWSSFMPFFIRVEGPVRVELTLWEKLRLWMPILRCWHYRRTRHIRQKIQKIEAMLEKLSNDNSN